METILQRIEKIAINEGIKITTFEKVIGASKGVLSRAINNGTDIQSKWLQMIVENYPLYSEAWLLSGRGNMLKYEGDDLLKNTSRVNGESSKMGGDFEGKMRGMNAFSHQNRIADGIQSVNETPVIYNSKQSNKAIPFYDLPVSAGSLGLIEFDYQINKVADGYIDMPIFAGCDSVLPVIGISMEPIIHSGDFIGIKSVPDVSSRWDFLQTGKIYLIVTHEDRMIKFLNQASDSEWIVCSSPNYSSFRVHKSEVLQIFRVAAVARGL